MLQLQNARLKGDGITFTAGGTDYTGKVNGNSITGTVRAGTVAGRNGRRNTPLASLWSESRAREKILGRRMRGAMQLSVGHPAGGHRCQYGVC